MRLEAQLREAIRERPDDDAARSVFADWLIEQGDPLGDFIAASLAPPSDARTKTMTRLWKTNHKAFTATIRASKVRRHAWHRGLPTWVTLNLDKSLAYAPELLERDPIVGVKVTAAKTKLGDLLALPELKHVRHLDMPAAGLGSRRMAAFAEHPTALRDVVSLHLGGNNIGRGAEHLVGLDMPNLRRLELHGNKLGDKVLEHLLRAPWIGGLTHIDLMFNDLTASGMRMLAEHPGLENVELIKVWEDGLGGADANLLLLDSTTLKRWTTSTGLMLEPSTRDALAERGIQPLREFHHFDLQLLLPRDFLVGAQGGEASSVQR